MRDLAELRISTICVVDGEILAGLRATRAPRPQAIAVCGLKSWRRALGCGDWLSSYATLRSSLQCGRRNPRRSRVLSLCLRQ